MSRPNKSTRTILDTLERNSFLGLSVNELVKETGFSELTVRTELKRLVAQGSLEADKHKLPYKYTPTFEVYENT